MDRPVSVKRDVRITKKQKQILVSCMEKHMEFAKAQVVGVEGKLRYQQFWQKLVIALNKYEPQKETDKWQRAWSDLKMATKKKAIAIHKWQAGGSPPSIKTLSNLEERILNIIGRESVYSIIDPEGTPMENAEPEIEIKEDGDLFHTEPVSTSWQTDDFDSCSTTSSVHAAEDLKILPKETNSNVDKFMEELNKNLQHMTNSINILNNNFVSSQNVTNSLLERIAVAIENRK